MTKNKKTELLGRGTWISIGSPVITELISSYPFDWLLFDMEHGYLTEDSLLGNMQAVRRNEIRLVVRVPCFDPALIARVLDRGASGIMVPHISSAEQAAACVDALYYPPQGNRGYSSQVRSFNYGLKKSADIENLNESYLIVQIEDYEGVMNAENIAQVDGVDVLFIGTSDLKLDLSTRAGSTMAFIEAVKIVVNAAIKNRKQAGILLKNVGDITEYAQLGFTCLAVSSDLGMLRKGYQVLATQLKNL